MTMSEEIPMINQSGSSPVPRVLEGRAAGEYGGFR